MNINEKVCTAQIFVCSWFLWKQTCGKSNGFENGGCHQSKFQLYLKISVDIHSHSTKSKSSQRSKFWPPPIQTSSLTFMTVRTKYVYFPASFCLVLQIDFSQYCVSVVGSLEIDLWQVYMYTNMKVIPKMNILSDSQIAKMLCSVWSISNTTHPCVTALTKSHLVGSRKLPDLRNSLLVSKTKTMDKFWKINKSWLHPYPTWIATLIDTALKSLTYNVFTFVRIFHPKRAWSGFAYPGANECSLGDKSLSHQGCDTGVVQPHISTLDGLREWRFVCCLTDCQHVRSGKISLAEITKILFAKFPKIPVGISVISNLKWRFFEAKTSHLTIFGSKHLKTAK